MKAPVGLLSGRAVCVSRWRGFAPTSSAERSKRISTGGVVKANGICSAAFCESAALGGKYPLSLLTSFAASSPKGAPELPQSKPDGFASSLWEGAFGMTGKFQAQAQSLRARLLPRGELSSVARLRGSKSAEPEKTVKRSSRRTGVNLQFFPV